MNDNQDNDGDYWTPMKEELLTSELDIKEEGFGIQIEVKAVEGEDNKFIHQCDLCGKRFDQYPNLFQHKKTIHGLKLGNLKGLLFECHECGKTYTSKYNFGEHLKSHQPMAITCKPCRRTYKSLASFKLHKKRMHNDKWRSCTECNFRAFEYHTLIRHLRNKHNILDRVSDDGSFHCNMCTNKFKELKLLELHMPFHLVYPCTYCFYYAKNELQLTRHQRTHSEDETENKRKCLRCSYTSESYDKILEHVCLPNLLVCEQCNFTSGSAAQLQIHFDKQHVFKPTHTCVLCKKMFCDAENYKSHVQACCKDVYKK